MFPLEKFGVVCRQSLFEERVRFPVADVGVSIFEFLVSIPDGGKVTC